MNDSLPDISQIEAVALAEVRSPRLGVTEQFFSVHSLAEEAPVACAWKTEDCWLVHLRVKEQRYFYVVRIDEHKGVFKATAGFSNACARVYLALYSKDLSPEEITSVLGIPPSDVRRKGDRPRKGASEFSEHCWCVYPDCPKALDFELQLSFLLEKLHPLRGKLNSLQEKVHGVVQVAYYEYAALIRGWHLESQAIDCLHELGLELDVDVYIDGPDLPD